jgi:hypothetical protein
MKNEETPSVDGVVWAYFCNMSIVFIKLDKQTYFYYSLSLSFAGGNNGVLGLEPLKGASNKCDRKIILIFLMFYLFARSV